MADVDAGIEVTTTEGEVDGTLSMRGAPWGADDYLDVVQCSWTIRRRGSEAVSRSINALQARAQTMLPFGVTGHHGANAEPTCSTRRLTLALDPSRRSRRRRPV